MIPVHDLFESHLNVTDLRCLTKLAARGASLLFGRVALPPLARQSACLVHTLGS